jgi:hypothetical protein
VDRIISGSCSVVKDFGTVTLSLKGLLSLQIFPIGNLSDIDFSEVIFLALNMSPFLP